MLKKVVGGVVIGAILGCSASVATRNVLGYILFYDLLFGCVLFVLLMSATSLIWMVLPKNLAKAWRGKKDRFTVVSFLAILLCLFVQPIIDLTVLSGTPGFIRSLNEIGTVVFVVFLGWCLLGSRKRRITISGTVVFILFTALLPFVSPSVLKSSEASEVDSIGNLSSLGYVDWAPAEEVEKRGVTHDEPELSFSGMSLYTSRPLQEADLIDMQGNVVHKWVRKLPEEALWQHIEMCKNGDLLVVSKDRKLMRLDWDSKVKWQKKMRANHDVSVDEDGTIYALSREDRLVFWHGIPVPILSDCVVVLSAYGEVKNKIHLYELVKEHFSLNMIVKIHKKIFSPVELSRILANMVYRNYIFKNSSIFDIMHTNSIEIIDRDIEGFGMKGDWLISIRGLDLVGVIDPTKEELVWAWGPGELKEQHHPTLLKNGNVLIFDNRPDKKSSRIVELNPLGRKIEWEYKSDPPEEFFSRRRGSSQRLPNGNTLITESDKGRVFEITKEGKVVWEFYNPDVNTRKKTRAIIYRLMRISNFEIPELLKK